MNDTIKMVAALVVGVALGAVLAGMNVKSQPAGGVTIEDEDFQGKVLLDDLNSKFKLGTNGTELTKFITGTCNAATTEGALEASSTDDYTCTVTGAASGDKVFVSLPQNGTVITGGFIVDHVVASTNTITFGITNLTGAATTSFAQATTSVQYWVIDN